MQDQFFSHPLDRLLPDRSLFFLEAMIPFVDFEMKRMLVIFIKMKEIQALMDSLSDLDRLNASGFNVHIHSKEDFINTICDFLPPEMQQNIRRTMQMMEMMQTMENVSGYGNGTSTSDISGFKNTPSNNSDIFSHVMDILNEDDFN